MPVVFLEILVSVKIMPKKKKKGMLICKTRIRFWAQINTSVYIHEYLAGYLKVMQDTGQFFNVLTTRYRTSSIPGPCSLNARSFWQTPVSKMASRGSTAPDESSVFNEPRDVLLTPECAHKFPGRSYLNAFDSGTLDWAQESIFPSRVHDHILSSKDLKHSWGTSFC